MLTKSEIKTLMFLSDDNISSEALEIAKDATRLMKENRQLKEENDRLKKRMAEEEARVGV